MGCRISDRSEDKQPAQSFAELVRSLGPRIDAALAEHTELGEGCPARLREAMRYSLLAPGKRLRPMLVLLSCEACGGAMDAAMPAACAVEMVHAYSLIHDDLPAMDDDDLRRGRPTCHKAFDEATAILAGDALLTRAFEVLANEIQPPACAAACCAALAAAAGACNMVGGQMDDVRGAGGQESDEGAAAPATVKRATPSLTPDPQSLNLDRSALSSLVSPLTAIHNRKTGAIIRVSLRLGAMVAGANGEQLAALDDYGGRLGLAFQITDDLLDVRSSQSVAGKRVGKDALRGKLTFPGVLGLDQSAQHAEQLTFQACQSLKSFGLRAEALCAVARYVVERDR